MSKPAQQHVATFVAGQGVTLELDAARRAVTSAGVFAERFDWLADGVALDVFFACADAVRIRDALRASLVPLPVDVIVQQAVNRRKALLVADMDSTMIEQECIDEVAEAVGLREPIAKLTQRAMRGEIGFEAALTQRVAMLKGISVTTLADIASRLTPTPGAKALIATMRAQGAYTALVSGGFTLFTEHVAALLGFHETRANRLVVQSGVLTGEVALPVLGRKAKVAAFDDIRNARGLSREATLAVGDGANDLDMVAAGGLGVAYRAKPVLADAADARIDHADLKALLYAQGFKRAEIVE